MSDGEDTKRDDSIRHASNAARSKAIEKMKAAQARVGNDSTNDSTEEPAKPKDTKAQAGSMADFIGKGEAQKTAEEPYKQQVDTETGQPLLKNVRVYSPFKVYFENDAFSVSATNGTGPFDILPGHKNFLSLLLPGDITIRARAGDETIKIDRGVMHVHNDVIKIFLDV